MINEFEMKYNYRRSGSGDHFCDEPVLWSAGTMLGTASNE
jgi:hypothetical protein